MVTVTENFMSRVTGSRNEGRQVYLSGPMRGYKDHNFPAFLAAAEQLRDKGYVVFSPAEHDIESGFDYRTGRWAGREHTIREMMLNDLGWIARYADLVVCLPGWRKSKGALAEVHAARSVNIPVYELDDMLNGIMRKVIL